MVRWPHEISLPSGVKMGWKWAGRVGGRSLLKGLKSLPSFMFSTKGQQAQGDSRSSFVTLQPPDISVTGSDSGSAFDYQALYIG